MARSLDRECHPHQSPSVLTGRSSAGTCAARAEVIADAWRCAASTASCSPYLSVAGQALAACRDPAQLKIVLDVSPPL